VFGLTLATSKDWAHNACAARVASQQAPVIASIPRIAASSSHDTL